MRIDTVAIVKIDAQVRHFVNVCEKKKVRVQIAVDGNAMPVAVATACKVANLAGAATCYLKDKGSLEHKFKHVIQGRCGDLIAQQRAYFWFFHTYKKRACEPFLFLELRSLLLCGSSVHLNSSCVCCGSFLFHRSNRFFRCRLLCGFSFILCSSAASYTSGI